MSKPLNQNASKPPDQRVWGKGRITADLGTDLKERLISYSRHEKRTMKEILIKAVESAIDPFRLTRYTKPRITPTL
jgi:hypothetical protein